MERDEIQLKELFDLQRFAGNARLARLIEETVRCYDGELSDDALDLVTAAGDMDAARWNKKGGDPDDK